MIARILRGSPAFAGVNYNTNKIDRNNGELMLTANFGPLQTLSNLRPADYINYLKMVSALNKGISDPQFHATISAKGGAYDKHALTKIAVLWLNEMGYGNQPYLVAFHKDTANNHVRGMVLCSLIHGTRGCIPKGVVRDLNALLNVP